MLWIIITAAIGAMLATATGIVVYIFRDKIETWVGNTMDEIEEEIEEVKEQIVGHMEALDGGVENMETETKNMIGEALVVLESKKEQLVEELDRFKERMGIE